MRSWLALRDREGLTYAELSKRSGIPRGTLTSWSWKLRRSERGGFTELKVVDEPLDPGAVAIRVLVGDLSVEVRDGFDPDLLSRVVSALRSGC